MSLVRIRCNVLPEMSAFLWRGLFHVVQSAKSEASCGPVAVDSPQSGSRSEPALAGVSRRFSVVHFIAAPGGGGAEAMMRNLVRAMDPGRWRNVVIVMDGRPWPREMEELRAMGAEVHDLEATAFLRAGTLVKLVRLLREVRPDVLQTWMHHADFVGGWCARLAGVRRVVWGIHCREIHASPGESAARIRWFRRLLGASSRVLPSRVISCSAAAIRDHAAMGYPEPCMTWVPNGIDTSVFKPDAAARVRVRQELRVPESAPLVGFVGRFHEMKDLPTWLRAAAVLQSRRPETHFLLCGGHEPGLGDCARAALSVMPFRQQVHFAPFRADPQAVYPALDVFSLSSRTEACPMTLMEALACGVPCVTTDVGDCARLLGDSGSVVPVHDAEALARAWEEMLDHRPDAAVLRRDAVGRFDIRAAARGYENVYREVLSA